MKQVKTLFALLLVLGTAVGFTAPAFAAGTVPPAPVKFVVLGDSIAAGSNMLFKSRAYAWIVARKMGWELNNYALGGSTSEDMLRQLKEDQTVRRSIGEADVIAVSVGGNDFLRAEELTTLITEGLLGDHRRGKQVVDNFRSVFDDIAAELRALNPDARLIMQTLYNPAFSLPSLYTAYDAVSVGINKVIYNYLDKQPDAYEVADVYGAFQGKNGLIFFDMTHPSAAGHKMVAAVLLDTINGTQTDMPPVFFGAADWFADMIEPALCRLDPIIFNESVFESIRPALWFIDNVFIEEFLNKLFFPVYIWIVKDWK